MAAAFMRAGFSVVDVHMSDLLEGRDDLANYQGLVACGGFSFGDVLGAGGGWAKSILYHSRTRDQFQAARIDTGFGQLAALSEEWFRAIRGSPESRRGR
jgi:phosphoribosylformylglycinamidine (FGAM) synthase-like amidotransferase family enzyme